MCLAAYTPQQSKGGESALLLRSITKHVKDQNWFAVALDFVIVVIGVFIGIQVANWNEARLVRQEQRAFLEQLYADLAPESNTGAAEMKHRRWWMKMSGLCSIRC